MNTIYRTIWNDALASWVAVPETQAACGKASRKGRSRTVRNGVASAALCVLTLAAIPQAVLAACPADAATGMAVTDPAPNNCVAAGTSYTGTLYTNGAGNTLTATSPTGFTLTTGNDDGVRANSGSAITLGAPAGTGLYTFVMGNNPSLNAIQADNGGRVTVNGSVHATVGTGDQDTVIYASTGDSQIDILGDTTIIHHGGSGGGGGMGVEFGTHNTIHAHGNVTLTTDGTAGIYAAGGTGNLVTVDGVYTATIGSNGNLSPFGAVADSEAIVQLNQASITLNNSAGIGLYALANGTVNATGNVTVNMGGGTGLRASQRHGDYLAARHQWQRNLRPCRRDRCPRAQRLRRAGQQWRHRQAGQ